MDSIEWDLEYSRQHGSQIILTWLVLRRFTVICLAYGYVMMGGVILDLQSIMKMLCWSPCGEMFLFGMPRIDHFIILQWQNADIPQWEMHPRTKAAQLFPHLLQAIPRAWTNLPSRPFQSGPVTTQWYNSLCLFSTSSEPVFLVWSSTRTTGIYSRIVEQYQETPICIAKWEKTYGNLSTSQWTLLWKTLINVNLIPLFSGTSFGVFFTGFCQRKPIYIDGITALYCLRLYCTRYHRSCL